MSGPFANPGAHGVVNPDKPHLPGGDPTRGRDLPTGHPGLGHGHNNPNDPRPDRGPVYDFLGNLAMPDNTYEGQGRWG